MGPQRKLEWNTAIDAVRTATRVCRAVQTRLVRAETIEKKDRSPVTIADFASQAVVCAMLERALPEDRVVGEEQSDELSRPSQASVRASVTRHVANVLGDSAITDDHVLHWIDRGGAAGATGPRCWTVDPIDGTKGFLRGGHYAVALALLEKGEVVLGVLGCPHLEHHRGTGALVAAEKDRGTFVLPLDGDDDDGPQVRVGAAEQANEARFCESVESGHSSHDDASRIARRLGIVAEPLRMDSQAKYAAVACGEAHIYLRLPTRADYREKIWDHAAGLIVVTEAGGRVTDIHGQSLDFSEGRRLERNQGVIATNGRLHDQVLQAVRETCGLGRS